jgi:potential 5'-3' exonuclease
MTDKKNLFLIDLSHVIYRYYYTIGFKEGTDYEYKDNQFKILDTGMYKKIFSFVDKIANLGQVLIFEDSKLISRNKYFEEHFPNGYKDNRHKRNDELKLLKESISQLLKQYKQPAIKKFNYEADDLIKEAVRVAKKSEKYNHIYILTNDFDLAPLIDDEVTLYRRSPRSNSSHLEPHPFIYNYEMIGKGNYEDYFKTIGMTKEIHVPYNSILLFKMIRGDKSDNIAGVKGVGPKSYNNFISQMTDEEIQKFKYYDWTIEAHNKTKDITYYDYDEIPLEEIKTDEFEVRYKEPKELKELALIIKKYFSTEVAKEIIIKYRGMALNAAYKFDDSEYDRKPIHLNKKVLELPNFNSSKISYENVINIDLV